MTIKERVLISLTIISLIVVFTRFDVNLYIASITMLGLIFSLIYIALLNNHCNKAVNQQANDQTIYNKEIANSIQRTVINKHVNHRNEEKLNLSNQYDQLTGLNNQQGLYALLNQYSEDKALTFYISLSDYNKIVDYYGAEISDEMIIEFSNLLKKHFKGDFIIARYFTDTFVVIYKKHHLKHNLEEKVKHQLQALTEYTYKMHDYTIKPNLKVGYAFYPLDAKTLEDSISLASIAMKSVLFNQKNIKGFNKDMQFSLSEEIHVSSKINEAIKNNLIESHMQKIINTKTNQTVYLEALARWNDQLIGDIPPDKFLRIARNSGSLIHLEEYLIKETLKGFKALDHKAVLSINMAPETFLNPSMVQYLVKEVQALRINPSQVCIEISENTFKYDLNQCTLALSKFKDAGFLIALDDFGTNYASLSILDKIDFDVIKIDRQFTHKIKDEINQEVVKMLVNIAKKKKKKIIVEGVETKEQAIMMENLGCHLQQGFYHHRPESIESIASND